MKYKKINLLVLSALAFSAWYTFASAAGTAPATPTAVVNGRRPARNCIGEFVEHQIARTAVVRQFDLLAALVRIDKEAVR